MKYLTKKQTIRINQKMAKSFVKHNLLPNLFEEIETLVENGTRKYQQEGNGTLFQDAIINVLKDEIKRLKY